MRPRPADAAPVPQEFQDAVKDLPPVVLAKDAAAFLHTSERTLRRWAATGRLRVVRTADGGGKVLILRTEIARVLHSMLVPAPYGG